MENKSYPEYEMPSIEGFLSEARRLLQIKHESYEKLDLPIRLEVLKIAVKMQQNRILGDQSDRFDEHSMFLVNAVLNVRDNIDDLVKAVIEIRDRL